MNDTLKVLIPSGIGLIATVFTAWIGYRQWKRQQMTTRYGSYITEKQTAYKELWKRLEEVHLRLRTDDPNESEFHSLILAVNSYILQNSLYLEEYDRELSNQYLRAVRKMKALVTESGDKESLEALNISAAIPQRVTSDARELGKSVREVDRLRSTLIERFREVIAGSV